MSAAAKRAWIIFGISVVVITAALCLIELPMFDGEVTWISGGREYTVAQQLSLSYFFGIGLEDADLTMVKEFSLTGQGWLLVFIFTVGLPGLIAYRIYLGKTKRETEEK